MEVTQRRPAGGNLGKLSSTRQGTFTVALVSALIAAAILVFALHKYRQSVETKDKAATVLVATQFIQHGTSGAAIGVGHYYKPSSILDKQVTSGALADAAALHGEVASRDIYPGQQLTAADFVSGGLFYSKLPSNQRAISLPLDTAHGLVGDIHDGDRVDVYASFPKEPPREAFVRLVAAGVVVLDAGQLSSGAGGLGAGNSTSDTADVALEVGIKQAAELAYAAENGKVWLVLRPANGTSPSSEVINQASLLAANQPVSQGGTK
jgi:Flp pilus assembly protein CpaB